jgi:hypothetical protein
VLASLVVPCGYPCDVSLVSQMSHNLGWILLHGNDVVAHGFPSALGGFDRLAPGLRCCRCVYPNDSERCCLFGLDLAGALGVVASGLCENDKILYYIRIRLTKFSLLN